MNLEHKLVRVVKRHEELASLMARQGPKDAQDFARMSREYAELTPTVERILALQSAQREQADLELTQLGMAIEVINHEFSASIRAVRVDLRKLTPWANGNERLS